MLLVTSLLAIGALLTVGPLWGLVASLGLLGVGALLGGLGIGALVIAGGLLAAGAVAAGARRGREKMGSRIMWAVCL